MTETDRAAALVLTKPDNMTDRRWEVLQVELHRVLAERDRPFIVKSLGEPEADLESDAFISMWGHCLPWCVMYADQREGRPASEHGDRCEDLIGFTHGHSEDGSRATLTVSMEEPYLHGVYEASEVLPLRDQRRVALRVTANGITPDDAPADDSKVFHLTTGDARCIAAMLLRAADGFDLL